MRIPFTRFNHRKIYCKYFHLQSLAVGGIFYGTAPGSIIIKIIFLFFCEIAIKYLKKWNT